MRLAWTYYKINMRKIRISFFLIGILLFFFSVPVLAQKNVTVVLDPGHGGVNLGGQYGNITEKELTMIVAKSMKEELLLFEGITVILTRTDDIDMSLKDRVLFATKENADFFICLHFNMSEYHDLYGSEVWIPAYDSMYAKSYPMAYEFMNTFQEQGLFSRGIKTRLNTKGTDYYGILRHATANQLPAVLVEHCHIDHDYDTNYMAGKEALEYFGKKDAHAVAKYFNLSSEALGIDYSEHEKVMVDVPTKPMAQDLTPPTFCELTLLERDDQEGMLTFSLEAKDEESGILYYTYSLDGGETFVTIIGYEEPKVTFRVPMPEDQAIAVIGKAYNGYDIKQLSNIIELEPYSKKKPIVEDTTPQTELDITDYTEVPPPKEIWGISLALSIILLLCVVLGILLVVINRIAAIKKRRKRHRSKPKKKK